MGKDYGVQRQYHGGQFFLVVETRMSGENQQPVASH